MTIEVLDAGPRGERARATALRLIAARLAPTQLAYARELEALRFESTLDELALMDALVLVSQALIRSIADAGKDEPIEVLARFEAGMEEYLGLRAEDPDLQGF